MADLERFPPSHLGYGAAGILRPEAEEHYEREATSALLEDRGELETPQDAFDAFYIRHRLRRWLGTSCEVDRHNRVFPLYSTAAIRAAFAIGPEERHAERLHFEAIRAACPRLAAIPFDRGAWDPRLLAKDGEPQPGAEGPAELSVAAGADPKATEPADRDRGDPRRPRHRRVLSDWRRRHAATDTEIMQRHLVDDPSNPVFEVVDHDAVADALGRFGELREQARRQLYGALTAAIWLGGSEIALRPGGASEAPR